MKLSILSVISFTVLMSSVSVVYAAPGNGLPIKDPCGCQCSGGCGGGVGGTAVISGFISQTVNVATKTVNLPPPTVATVLPSQTNQPPTILSHNAPVPAADLAKLQPSAAGVVVTRAHDDPTEYANSELKRLRLGGN